MARYEIGKIGGRGSSTQIRCWDDICHSVSCVKVVRLEPTEAGREARSPDSKGMTEVNGEYGSASRKVNGRLNLG